ncbi:MAG: hypothetical protein SFV54_10150 [Bryobacteraceae bacterium]|nr:hypothetical protein [Bryobacteraceae bacterium]
MMRRTILAFAALTAAAFGQEMTVDQILAKHFEALGGTANLKAIESIKMSGKAVMGGGQMEAPMTVQTKRPNLMRADIIVQGQNITQAYDGATAWQVIPFQSMEPQKSSADDTESMAQNADLDGPLMDYAQKGNKVELIGKEDVEGSPAYKLKLTRKNGQSEDYYIDASSFLLIKSTAKRKQMGQELDIEIYPGNYKKVGNVMMAHSLEQKANGKPFMTMSFDKVEVNLPMDSAQFKMPEPKKPEEKK